MTKEEAHDFIRFKNFKFGWNNDIEEFKIVSFSINESENNIDEIISWSREKKLNNLL